MKFNSFSFTSIFIVITITLIFSLCVFVPSLSQYGSISAYNLYDNNTTFNINSSQFIWPTPGYTTITSPFGPRKSPITGKSSYHYGIDIGAPESTTIYAIFSGTVTYTGFNGANGFTVTIVSGNISASYSHVSPNFIVYVGQSINQGEPIANVGPKNVYNVPNNPYKDSNGNPTNRIYNWSSFAFKHKRRRQSRQSF